MKKFDFSVEYDETLIFDNRGRVKKGKIRLINNSDVKFGEDFMVSLYTLVKNQILLWKENKDGGKE